MGTYTKRSIGGDCPLPALSALQLVPVATTSLAAGPLDAPAIRMARRLRRQRALAGLMRRRWCCAAGTQSARY